MASATCIVLSFLAGLIISSGYNVLSYAGHRAETRGIIYSRWTNALLSVTNVLLSLAGIGLFVVASKYGPVSVAMPVQTAASLLLNMVIQSCAGIKAYTKPMRVGTLVLAAASICLMNVGPTDPESIDVVKLVSTTVARIWLVSMLALLILSLLVLRRGAGGRDNVGMLGYAVLVADSTALGATVGKMITVTTDWARVCCLLGYALMGAGSLLGGLAAARKCDIAVYLPTSQCIQLVINACTGLFVWGDGQRVQAPVSYAMIFVLVLLGVYLCSEVDLADMGRRRGTSTVAAGDLRQRIEVSESVEGDWVQVGDRRSA